MQHALHVLTDAREMIDLCERRGLASLNRSPLALGLLTGKFGPASTLPSDDVRGRSPAWLTYFIDGRPYPQWLALLAELREVLTANGHTRAQAALAWILARSPNTIPIPGARTASSARERCRTRARATDPRADGAGREPARRYLSVPIAIRSVCALPPADRTVTA